jgi:hypothetical protein
MCSTRQGYSRIVKGFDEFAVYRAVQLNPDAPFLHQQKLATPLGTTI